MGRLGLRGVSTPGRDGGVVSRVSDVATPGVGCGDAATSGVGGGDVATLVLPGSGGDTGSHPNN